MKAFLFSAGAELLYTLIGKGGGGRFVVGLAALGFALALTLNPDLFVEAGYKSYKGMAFAPQWAWALGSLLAGLGVWCAPRGPRREFWLRLASALFAAIGASLTLGAGGINTATFTYAALSIGAAHEAWTERLS